MTPPRSMGPVHGARYGRLPCRFWCRPCFTFWLSTRLGLSRYFIPVYILTHGGPANSTLTIGYFIYRQVFYYGDLGVAAAAGLILLLVTVGFTIAQFHRFSQVVEY